MARFFARAGMELSKAKSVCTASSRRLGNRLARRWKVLGIRFEARVKALGAGLGAGVRRNTRVLKKRIVDFAARIPRFRRLKRAGVNTARLLRTGMRAMTYGESIGGVSNSTLHTQRKIAGVVSALASGTCVGSSSCPLRSPQNC